MSDRPNIIWSNENLDYEDWRDSLAEDYPDLTEPQREALMYELNADYVKYSRFLGIKDSKIVGYVFRNAMLPQVTGLALSIGTMIGGALVAEIIFSYPGLGSTMYSAVTAADYPLISATTLIITIMVLIVTFLLDIIYGFIDPRVKAAQFDS